jgi:hypothetical protein
MGTVIVAIPHTLPTDIWYHMPGVILGWVQGTPCHYQQPCSLVKVALRDLQHSVVVELIEEEECE